MNQQDFLQECGKSYLQVLDALGYFREVVHEKCDRVVDKHIAVLAGVLGVDVDVLKRLPYADPDKPSSAGIESASLGCKAKRQEDLCFWFYINWNREVDQGESPLNVEIDIWLKDRTKAKSLAARLDNLCDDPHFADEPWCFEFDGTDCLCFYIVLEENEFPHFDQKLNQLLVFAVPFLKSLEGIQKYFLP
jgi:hypothetical protein